MNSDVEDLFDAARRLKDPSQRLAFLDAACSQDPRLRRELEELLALESDAQAMLDGGAASLDPEASELRQFSPTLLTCVPVKEQVGEWVGRYKLLQKLGEGGCGMVYMAEQEEPVRRRVALKIIKLGMDTRNVVARFEAERQALALMDHPNIAKVLDAGATDTGRPFFVMELVRGVKITEYCDQHALAVPERLDLFIQVCQAVQHAHQKGVIHRDLKPSNILVTVNDGVAVPKVIDFGIAKATGGLLTDRTLFTPFEQFVGTPAYMSPEQAAMTSVDIDTRSDIYSLGVLLYELLTGNTPFETKELLKAGLEEMRRLLRDREPARPSTRLTVLPATDLATVSRQRQTDAPRLVSLLRGDLDWIVMKALEKDRARRYETANGLVQDIQRYLHNEPVVARPPSTVYRFQKMVKRNKLVFAAASAVVTSLILALGISVSQYASKNRLYLRTFAAEASERAARVQAQRALADESQQRTEAEAAKVRLASALSQLQVQQAEELFAGDEPSAGLAHIARTLRQNPADYLSAQRLLSALSERNYALPLMEFIKHGTRVNAVEFSPDGRRLVAVSSNDTARVWDCDTGQLLAETVKHESYLSSASFSPDGLRIVTACGVFHDKQPHYAQVWDATTGRALTGRLEHQDYVWSASFSPDGRCVVTASADGTMRLWDANSGRELREPVIPVARGQAVIRARFSPDGLKLVTACVDGTAQLWDARTGQAVGQPIKHNGPVTWAEFSRDGQRVLTASSDEVPIPPLPYFYYFGGEKPPRISVAQISDANTGQALAPPLPHAGGISCARFSPDGLRVVTASKDNTARIWDARTSQPLGQALKHKGQVRYAEFSPDGLWILTASAPKTVQVWDARTGQALTEPLNYYGSAHFSPDGQRIVTAPYDGIMRIWDVRAHPRAVDLGLTNLVWSARFSRDGTRILTTSYDNTATVWDARTGWAIAGPIRHDHQLTYGAFSPDGLRVVTGVRGAKARIWDAQTGQLLETLNQKDVNFLEFSPDGRRLVTTSDDNTARVWNAQTGQPLTNLLKHSGVLRIARFSPDGRIVLTASDDGTARLWDAETGLPMMEPLKHEGSVRSAEFSTDGRLVLTASSDHTAQVWDAQTGRKVITLKHAADEWYGARFSPDGRRVVMASEDGTAGVWDMRTGQPLTRRLSQDAKVHAVQFSPNGQWIATTSSDQARVWDAGTGLPLTEPLRWEGYFGSAEFSPDGRRLLTVSKTARIWELPAAPLPVPSWVPDLAEAVGNNRFDEQGISQPVPLAELQALKKRITESSDSDAWTQLAKWLFAEPARQPNSSFSPGGQR